MYRMHKHQEVDAEPDTKEDLITMSIRVNRDHSKRVWHVQSIPLVKTNQYYMSNLEYKRGKESIYLRCQVIVNHPAYDLDVSSGISTYENRLDLCDDD